MVQFRRPLHKLINYVTHIVDAFNIDMLLLGMLTLIAISAPHVSEILQHAKISGIY